MQEVSEVIDTLLSPEALDLVVGVVAVGIQTPLAIAALAVAGLGAAFLPKAKAAKLMEGAKRLLTIKRMK